MGQRLSTPLKEKEWKVVNAAGDVQQILKETSADMVTVADAGNKFTATNVEGVLQELAIGVENAGDVKDVKNVDGTSIVDDSGVAQMKDAIVKEAGKTSSSLYAVGYNLDNTTRAELSFNGSESRQLTFTKGDFALNYSAGIGTIRLANSNVIAGTYNGITVDAKGRVTGAVDGDYATNTELAKKLDKAGGSITGNLTIGGNLNVNGSTTTIDSTTLRVEDKLIEVAKSNTTKLTTPAGIVVPKYDGTNYGALVIDGDGNAQVGDVVLDASGNINVNDSDLQTLATRTGLTNGNLVKWDETNKTLVPDTAVKSTADSALSKANTNATSITNIVKGDTEVGKATDVTTSINGNAISSIFESDGTTVKEATHATGADSATTATSADKVANALKIKGTYSTIPPTVIYDGSAAKTITLNSDDFQFDVTGYVQLESSGVTEGSYTALTVDSKGRATAGGRAFAFIEKDAAIPDDVMVGGLIFESVT